jgi:UDP-N-acetylmuramate--alanine ligase
MEKAGLDPTVIVGSKMLGGDADDTTKIQTNFHAGKSKYLVVEACEYRRSFLNLWPTILVITNIEPDHLDYYKDINDIKNAFEELKSKVPKNGFVVDENEYIKITESFTLPIPGEHNIKNAKTAISAVQKLGVPKEKAIEYLQDFKGTWRRLEYKGEKGQAIFYDDYAHHPSAIKATLQALRDKHGDRDIVAVFEPHQQKRTKDFFDDFVKSLSLADEVYIAPIYMARETPDATISNKILAQAIKSTVPARAVENVEELKKYMAEIPRSKSACVAMMGAGDIYKWTQHIIKV